jgi:hypothetical protein
MGVEDMIVVFYRVRGRRREPWPVSSRAQLTHLNAPRHLTGEVEEETGVIL